MKKHILVIEDNDDIRDNTAEILELAQYKVTVAANGKEGIEKAIENAPDLIICDIMMPVLDGHGVLHLIHKNPDLSHIPFIFLTAKTERTDFRKGMEMGADDYITKPFSDIELLNAIDSRLKKSALAMQHFSNDENGIKDIVAAFETNNELENITHNRPENTYRKKQMVYQRGNHPQKLFYVKSGKVKTYISNDDGKDLTIGLYSGGDFLGYIALLEGGTYKETAEAIDDCVIAEIPIEDLEKILNYNPVATKKIIQILAKNIREKERQLLDIAYNSLRKRVANALVVILNKYRKEEEAIFSIHLSREDLANIAGTATESLIRTLSDFKNEKLIEINAGKISILNEQKLQSMIN